MFDTLLSSFLLINENEYYIRLGADLDLVGNAVLYTDQDNKFYQVLADGPVQFIKMRKKSSDNSEELVISLIEKF